jgi:hypothetical protein
LRHDDLKGRAVAALVHHGRTTRGEDPFKQRKDKPRSRAGSMVAATAGRPACRSSVTEADRRKLAHQGAGMVPAQSAGTTPAPVRTGAPRGGRGRRTVIGVEIKRASRPAA